MDNQKAKGFRSSALKGFGWLGTLRGLMRAGTFLKLAIVARILSPEQFGIFGIATLVLAFLEIATDTGINVVLVQEADHKKYLNTAWVISIGRGIVLSLILFLLATPVSNFFSSPQAHFVLVLISVVPFMRGFINPAIIKFQKNLEFKAEFFFRATVFFTEAIVTVLSAIITHSAVSFVYGLMAGVAVEIVISFVFVRPLPKLNFSTKLARKVVRRGAWLTLAGMFNYIFENGDDFVVGKLVSTSALGVYQVGYKVSTLPLTEIANVFNRVGFPIFAKISDDKTRLKKAYLKSTLVVSLVSIPFGMFLYIFSETIVNIILGTGWSEVVPVIRVLALFGVIRAISGPSYSLYLSVKKQQYLFFYNLLSIAALGVTIVPLTKSYGAVGAGLSATIAIFVSLPLLFYYSWKLLK